MPQLMHGKFIFPPKGFARDGAGLLHKRSGDPPKAKAQAASRLPRRRSAAVFSWPQAASMSRPRGVRTGAEMPASKTMLLKALIRSSSEHS
jgi:hypothetical protein